MSDILSFLIASDPPSRLDKAIARDAPESAALSRTQLSRLLEQGAVRVNGEQVSNAKLQLSEGALIEITRPQLLQTDLLAEDIALDVLFEDSDLLVVNKPAGMVVHPAPGSPAGTLVNALLGHCGSSLSGVGGVKRPGIVHRIDKDTSGLLVVAKSDAAHQGLSAQFANHSVERQYRALCYGVPDQSTPRLAGIRGVSFERGDVLKITTQLGRHKTDRQRQAVCFEGGRHAVTRARRMEIFGQPAGVSELMCWLETGRTHQIRVHLAYAGHGLIGDPIYGGRRKLSKASFSAEAQDAVTKFNRQALHAQRLGFLHPITGETKMFEAPPPEDYQRLKDILASQ